MQWYEPVCKALNGAVFMQSNVQVFRDRIKPEDMVSLRFASDLLDRFSPERVVAEAELDRIRGLIADLYAELQKDTGIDPEPRKFLLYHVRLMEQAINHCSARAACNRRWTRLSARCNVAVILPRSPTSNLPPGPNSAILS
jgi:hypothetical protein